jgi:hypothetical protein
MDGSKVLNVTIGSPVDATASGVVGDPILDKLSDEPIIQPTKEEEKEARKFLKNVQSYLKSDKFIDDCNERAKKTGESPKKVATTYIGKVAGIIGDGLGMAVDTVNIGAVGLIDLISTLLTKAVNLICNIVRGIIRTVTFNRTNHVTATA